MEDWENYMLVEATIANTEKSNRIPLMSIDDLPEEYAEFPMPQPERPMLKPKRRDVDSKRRLVSRRRQIQAYFRF